MIDELLRVELDVFAKRVAKQPIGDIPLTAWDLLYRSDAK
jgi:hypothetical protein